MSLAVQVLLGFFTLHLMMGFVFVVYKLSACKKNKE